jgi:hypothetical protein
MTVSLSPECIVQVRNPIKMRVPLRHYDAKRFASAGNETGVGYVSSILIIQIGS